MFQQGPERTYSQPDRGIKFSSATAVLWLRVVAQRGDVCLGRFQPVASLQTLPRYSASFDICHLWFHHSLSLKFHALRSPAIFAYSTHPNTVALLRPVSLTPVLLPRNLPYMVPDALLRQFLFRFFTHLGAPALTLVIVRNVGCSLSLSELSFV